ncbi:hypothetical protein GOB90_08770 [Acetobacter oeni]|nr:hypothetical protein [Acetobacter oeni]
MTGDKAGEVRTADFTHTVIGIATNAGATIFWSVLYEKTLGSGKPSSIRFLFVTTVLGPVAVFVDYVTTPKRFTPGWEFVFSKRDMTLIYIALVTGMATGTGFIRQKSGSCRN